ncbi:MAG: hypothetical protein A3I02_09765 [Betaproteobacteria bacterium RIFCSPLOWO2_02_FULL_67_26]|nr:MAG: hypothetical protein A3I02_09765 [Betaproteobacteria bacterium RIFCSPLOWO2_02_FULL_67_26]
MGVSSRKSAELKIARLNSLYAALSETNEVIMRSRNRDELFRQVCHVAVTHGGFKLALLRLLDEATGEARLAAWVAYQGHLIDQAHLSHSIKASVARGPVGTALREGRHEVRNDFAAGGLQGPSRLAKKEGFRSGAAFPLKIEGKVVGALSLYAGEAGYFDDTLIGLLLKLADNVSFAIDKFEQGARQRRADQLLRLEHAVTRSLAEADTVSVALKAVMRAVCETEDWECGRYYRVDEQAGVLRFNESWSVPDATIERFIAGKREAVFGPGVGLAGRAWQSGEPTWVADVKDVARTLGAALTLETETDMRGSFHFPVKADGRTIGVLAFNSRKVREPDERLLQAVRMIGSQIGQFLQRKHAEEVVRDSEDRFRNLTQLSSDVYWEQDEQYRFTSFTERGAESIRSRRPQLIGKRRWDNDYLNMTPTDWAAHITVLDARKPFHDLELCRLNDASEHVWLSVSGEPIFDSTGNFTGYRGVGKGITARKREEQLRMLEHAVTRCLAEAESTPAALQAVIRTMCESLGWPCGRYFCADDKEGVLRFGEAWGVANDAVERFIAESRNRVYRPGQGLSGRVWESGQPLWSREASTDSRSSGTSRRSGGVLGAALVFPVISGGKTIGVFSLSGHESRAPDERLLDAIRVIGSQIGQFIQRRQAEDELAQLAQFDTVTGLPNRYLFLDRLGLMLTQAQRNDWLIGTLFVDLDRFKAVNDTYGHDAGDLLLRQVATRLTGCVRGGDTVGRLSGDEFAVMLSNLAKADDAGLVAQKIVSALTAPFDLGGHQAYISASIGIAVYPGDGGEPDILIKNADTAMYRAKEQGRNGYQFYLPQMNERLMQRLQLEARLRGALERGEFLLHYQPKVSLESGAITGFEALLRWRRGDLTVSPGEFIPILEETGLIVPVGEWVLRSVCEQIKRWEQQGVTPRPVAVNLSARQFQRKDLAAVVGQVLEDTGVHPGLIELELTETLLMSDAEEAVEMLHQLKALGVRLAVDDFGTGYSSLTYLKRFPLDSLKIDLSFIRDIVSNPEDATITRTIISLARGLKLKVVAEGVETEGQLNFLRSNGCDEMQGFYFARPMPVEDCTRVLTEDRRLQYPQAETAPDSPLLLLVDDSEDDLRVLKLALAPEGFHILTATCANDGFEILARYGVDIVISDQRMPEMTGVEFLSRVRKLYPHAVRVVAASGDDVPTITGATNRAGIHKFLSKDWDPDRLRAEVREAYQQRR